MNFAGLLISCKHTSPALLCWQSSRKCPSTALVATAQDRDLRGTGTGP